MFQTVPGEVKLLLDSTVAVPVATLIPDVGLMLKVFNAKTGFGVSSNSIKGESPLN